MKLYELLEGVAKTGLENTEITDITSDTRKELAPGFAFVCIKGNTFDGHNSAEEMLKRGAAVIIAKADEQKVDTVINDAHADDHFNEILFC